MSATDGLTREELFWISRNLAWEIADIGGSPAAAATANREVVQGQITELGGWAVRESTGTAAASFRLWDGGVSIGRSLVVIDLTAGESTRDFITSHGIAVYTGIIWVQIITGSVEGTIYFR